MSLDAAARRRYARQLLLAEIGDTGQERLLGAEFHCEEAVDAEVCAVAADYLERAGCTAGEKGRVLRAPGESSVTRFAGRAELRDCAVLIAGAHSAVEHLREILGMTPPSRRLPAGLRLSEED